MDKAKLEKITLIQESISDLQRELSKALKELQDDDTKVSLEDLDISVTKIEEAMETMRPVRHIR